MANTNKPVIAVLRGKTSYFKMLGDPRLNYSKDGKEWSTDIELTKEGVADCKALGISAKVKKKDEYLDGKPYIRFTLKELNYKGEPNDPVEVVDILGNPWPKDKLIGNGSTVDVKFAVKDYGVGKPKGSYIRKVRVLEHVPYESADSMPEMSEDDEYFAAFKAAQDAEASKKAKTEDEFRRDFGLADDDLDDEIPV